MQQQDSDGDAGFPWAFAFDPEANVRALGDVQRRGLQAASRAVDKLLASMDSRVASPGQATVESNGSDSDIRRLAGLWTELVTRGLSEMVRMGEADGPNGSGTVGSGSEPRVWIDLGSGQSAGSVEVMADSSGSSLIPGEVWLLNHSGEPRGPLRLHASELRSPEGRKIASKRVRFDPEVVELPGRSSRGVGVAFHGGKHPVPGVYRGIIQATGEPAVAVKIELTVSAT